MPESKYERDPNRFDCLGLDLNRPVDSVKPGKFPYMKNCRSYQNGRVEPRFGLTDLALVVAGASQVHSIRRLNESNGTFTRVIGTLGHLAYGVSTAITPFTDIDSGYSGNPLALVPWRPEESPTTFMYIGDSARMRKLSVAGSLHTIGLPAPAASPAVGLTINPQYKTIDDFESTAGWAQGGTAGAPALLTWRVDTTIAQILYDSGSTGWASIQPTVIANIGEGTLLTLNPGGAAEVVKVQSVMPGSVATAVGSINYDAGTTGDCSMVLETAIDQARCDALIRNTSLGENARIVAVLRGPNNTTSLRLSTTGTWSPGDSVQVLFSFRAYCSSHRSVADVVRTNGVRSAITSGTGTLTKVGAIDLSLLATGVPTLPDDYMHISMRVSDPTVITELKVLLDVNPGGVNNFDQNYYWKSFRANDLTPAASNLQSLLATRQQIIQRTIIDTPISATDLANQGLGQLDLGGLSPEQYAAQQNELQAQQAADAQQFVTELDTAISQQLDAGVTQWVELRFRLSDLIRIGTDQARTLQDVASIRIVALVTGNVDLDVDAWWVGGGYGPDTGDDTASAYLYRYRARNPATNVPSNFSPATRYAANPLRQKVTIRPTQYAAPSGTTLTTADFVLDIERFGGQVADWHYVGTIPNAASPTFTDIYDDETVAKQPILTNDNYQPWPVIGVPVSGTTGNVAGTSVDDSGANFDINWDPGTTILIKDQPYTIYRVISTSKLETVENVGTQTGVSWRIDEPVTLAQPLACLWQWDNRFWACADPVNAGRLYFSNPDSETTMVTNYIDVTSPSEPLMNGVEYNVRGWVFSSEDFFQILKTGNEVSPYYTQQVPNGKGLFTRWLLTREPAPFIAFGSKDGLYMTTGGAAIPLTDADMYPLFPNEGNQGATTNGILAPVYTAIQARRLRLGFYDDFLYFDYPSGELGTPTTLVLAFNLGATERGEAPGGWFFDVYTPPVLTHYGEEGNGVHSLLCGGNDQHLYQYAGDSDNGTAIRMELTTPSKDQGDPRSEKLYGDIMLDANTEGLAVTVTPYFDNNTTSATPVVVNTATRTQTPIPFDSAWVTARNISMFFFCNVSTSARPKFYIWEPRWTFEAAPVSSQSWEISPTSFGAHNFTSMGIIRIAHVSTSDLSLIVTLDGVVQPTITVPNSSGVYEQTVFRVPVWKAKLWKLRLASDAAFRLDTRDTFFEVKEWASDGPYAELRVFGDFAMVEG
jgi:hypothetical protein